MSRLLRAILATIAIACSFTLATAAPIAAQTSPDIAAIGESVLAADPDDLLAALESPIDDADLPEGFTGATFVDPDAPEATPEPALLIGSALDGSLGSTAWTIAPDDDVFDGETISTVQFVILDESDFTEGFLDEFVTGAEGATEGQEGASVETIEIEGVEAALIAFDAEGPAGAAYVRYIAIPVGNMFVLANVSTQTDDLNGDDVYDYAEALTLAAIGYVGTVLEDL